jgi:peptide/histidine transporter 3/4
LGAGLHVPGYSPEQVEEVRLVVRLLPIFFTTILYWTIYAQMGTFFIMQARPRRKYSRLPVHMSPSAHGTP